MNSKKWPALWVSKTALSPVPVCISPWRYCRDVYDAVNEQFGVDAAMAAVEAIFAQVKEGNVGRKRHINEQLKSGLANSGRAAGMGMLYDRYDEESGLSAHGGSVRVVTPSDFLTAEERKALSGDVVVYVDPALRQKGATDEL